MTLENYKGEVLRLLRKQIHDAEYLKAIEPDIEQHYKSCMNAKKLLGGDPDPKSYVLTIQFLYPELP